MPTKDACISLVLLFWSTVWQKGNQLRYNPGRISDANQLFEILVCKVSFLKACKYKKYQSTFPADLIPLITGKYMKTHAPRRARTSSQLIPSRSSIPGVTCRTRLLQKAIEFLYFEKNCLHMSLSPYALSDSWFWIQGAQWSSSFFEQVRVLCISFFLSN